MSKLRQKLYHATTSPQKLGAMLTREIHAPNPSLDKIKDLIEAGATLNEIPNIRYDLPLIKAAENGYSTIVDLLLNAGGAPDARNQHNETALMKASSNGHVEVIDRLIVAGADLEAQDTCGYTALFKATMHGNTQAVRVLAAAGANTEVYDEDETPLDNAALAENVEMLHCLLEYGAEVTQLTKTSLNFRTPEVQHVINDILENGTIKKQKERETARLAAEAVLVIEKKHEEWIKAGMPLNESLTIKNKPLRFNR